MLVAVASKESVAVWTVVVSILTAVNAVWQTCARPEPERLNIIINCRKLEPKSEEKVSYFISDGSTMGSHLDAEKIRIN